MSPSPEESEKRAGKSLVKALALIAFIILAVLSVRFTRLGGYFSAESLQHFLARAGFWAPLAFIFSYAAGICLLIPGTVLTGIGGALFGTAWGFVYNWTGAMIGSTASFLVARTLGREFASRLAGKS